jgi:hypothetical protein
MDIVVPFKGKPTGFLASDADGYAAHMHTILSMPEQEQQTIQASGPFPPHCATCHHYSPQCTQRFLFLESQVGLSRKAYSRSFQIGMCRCVLVKVRVHK